MRPPLHRSIRYRYSPRGKRGSSFVEATVIIGMVAVLIAGLLTPALKVFDSGITSDGQLLPVMTIRAVAMFDDGTASFNHSELPLERARIRSELTAEGFTTPSCIHAYNIRRGATGCSVVLDSEDPACVGDMNKTTCERMLRAAGCSDYVYGCFTSTSGSSAVVRLLQPEFHLSPQAGPTDPTSIIPPTQTPTPTPPPTPEPTPLPTPTPIEIPPSPSPTATPEPTGTLPPPPIEVENPQPEPIPSEEPMPETSELPLPLPELNSREPGNREHPAERAPLLEHQAEHLGRLGEF